MLQENKSYHVADNDGDNDDDHEDNNAALDSTDILHKHYKIMKLYIH